MNSHFQSLPTISFQKGRHHERKNILTLFMRGIKQIFDNLF